MMRFIRWLLIPSLCSAVALHAQPVTDMVVSPAIGTPQLYPAGNQLGYPIIRLNSTDQLELSFDDLDADVKAYS
ncbi:MAG TPA: type IX secretion system plug protein domain-containing protein, partial [Puia sp.]|nr:type IX secretion system plug protein domain-containing protein [Puia sp.]